MEVFTIQLAQRRVAYARNITVIDTTVKTGDPIFAPTWDIVMGHKRGEINDEEYRSQYMWLMSQSWQANPDKWQLMLHRTDPVALGCYCQPGVFCHRHLLNQLLNHLCRRQGIPYLYYGELLPDAK